MRRKWLESGLIFPFTAATDDLFSTCEWSHEWQKTVIFPDPERRERMHRIPIRSCSSAIADYGGIPRILLQCMYPSRFCGAIPGFDYKEPVIKILPGAATDLPCPTHLVQPDGGYYSQERPLFQFLVDKTWTVFESFKVVRDPPT